MSELNRMRVNKPDAIRYTMKKEFVQSVTHLWRS